MTKQFKTVIACTLIFALAITMGSCGWKAHAAETFSGKLIDLQGDRVVVKNTEKTMLFMETSSTEYFLDDEKELCIGDEVKVSFSKKDGVYNADSIELISHKDDSLVFGGQVIELEKHYITVHSESLTVGFDYDNKTIIDGNLTEGDSVIITYDGDISDRPYAISIVVIEEKEKVELKSLHGTLSEIADKSILVSMDSADAARFTLTNDTVIEGESNHLDIGDKVIVLYTGDIKKGPEAKTIKITEKKVDKYYVMDGVIDSVSKDFIALKTVNSTYKFKILKDTRIQNKDYMKKGHKSTVTYVGELGKDAIAASIYCSKETINNKNKETTTKQKESTTKQQSSTTKATRTATTTTGTTTQTTTQTTTSETTTEEPTTTEGPTTETEEIVDPDNPDVKIIVIKAIGTIVTWDNPCIIKLDGGSTMQLDITKTNLSAGYNPKAGDSVVIKYNKDTLELLDIQLVYRFASN